MSKKLTKHPKLWTWLWSTGDLSIDVTVTKQLDYFANGKYIRIRIVPEADYRAMRKAWRESR